MTDEKIEFSDIIKTLYLKEKLALPEVEIGFSPCEALYNRKK